MRPVCHSPCKNVLKELKKQQTFKNEDIRPFASPKAIGEEVLVAVETGGGIGGSPESELKMHLKRRGCGGHGRSPGGRAESPSPGAPGYVTSDEDSESKQVTPRVTTIPQQLAFSRGCGAAACLRRCRGLSVRMGRSHCPGVLGTEASSTRRATWTHTVRAAPAGTHWAQQQKLRVGATGISWSVRRYHQGIQESLRQGFCISSYY